jgi:Ca2+-binding RTX toxin-like protein
VIKINNSTDSIRIKNWFHNNRNQIEKLVFMDGTIVSQAEISQNVIIQGTEGNDVLRGYKTDDVIMGLGGDDLIIADKGGNDTIVGGMGNDTIRNTGGSDTYVFDRGDGVDSIWDKDKAGESATDTILFGETIAKTDIAIFMDKNDLVIDYGNGDKVIIEKQKLPTFGVEQVELDNGLFLTDADINRIIHDMTVFSKDHGIAMQTVDDVRNNAELMGIVAGAWQV